MGTKENNGEWVKIRSEKGEGFVSNKFLIKNENKSSHSQNKQSGNDLCGVGITVNMENGILRLLL